MSHLQARTQRAGTQGSNHFGWLQFSNQTSISCHDTQENSRPMHQDACVFKGGLIKSSPHYVLLKRFKQNLSYFPKLKYICLHMQYQPLAAFQVFSRKESAIQGTSGRGTSLWWTALLNDVMVISGSRYIPAKYSRSSFKCYRHRFLIQQRFLIFLLASVSGYVPFRF